MSNSRAATSASAVSSDVVVIGAGVIGCSIAWRLAQRERRTIVIEQQSPGGGASWAAAGMLTPLVEAHEPAMHRLARASSERYARYVDELRTLSGIDPELHTSGKIDVAFTAEELDHLRTRYGIATESDIEPLSPAELRTIEPTLSEEIVGGLLLSRDASVDSRKLSRAAWSAAVAAGVRFETGRAATELVIGTSGVEGVRVNDGTVLTAEQVVIAAGAWSGALGGLRRQLPVIPVRGQMLALTGTPLSLSHMIVSTACYLVPRPDGRVLIGATVEYAGFDDRTTAGGIAQLLQAALRILPALANSTVSEVWSGLRPGTPDDLPILGEDDELRGLYYATGHFRNGILLAPITAEIVADLITAGSTEFDLRAFGLERFGV